MFAVNIGREVKMRLKVTVRAGWFWQPGKVKAGRGLAENDMLEVSGVVLSWAGELAAAGSRGDG